jgi:hypothetical protein
MAGKVFLSVSMSLDGFIAPESMEGFIASEERRNDPDVQRLDGAVDGTAAVDLPAAILPGEPEARRGRRGGARQRDRAGDVRAHRRERDGQAHVRPRREGVAGGGAVPHAGLRRDAREA